MDVVATEVKKLGGALFIESKPGAGDLSQRGKPVDIEKNRSRVDLDYTGSAMPPLAAVANAVEDALTPFNVKVTSLPITPEKVMNAILHTKTI